MIRGIRGAITVDDNRRELIVEAAKELVTAMLAVNDLSAEDVASIIFTVTPDLTAEFPAVGARAAGLGLVPLLCSVEIPVPGSQPRCIRALMHANCSLRQDQVRHVYLREAQSLRPDLVAHEGVRGKE